MPKNILKNKLLSAIAIGALITLILTAFSLTNIFNSWHLKIADTLYTNNPSSQEIVIIGIDEKSTYAQPEGLGQFGKWSRENYVKLLDVLAQNPNQAPKVIVFDLLFDTQTQEVPIEKIKELKYEQAEGLTNGQKLDLYENFIDSNSSLLDNSIDTALAEKFYETENLILAFFSNNGNPIFPINKFSINAKLGDVFAEVDDDGILRKVPPFYQDNGTYYPDMAVAAVQEYLEADDLTTNNITSNSLTIKSATREIQIPLEDGKMNMSYFEDPGHTHISFVDVLNGNFEEDVFKDKIVLVGVSELTSTQDTVTTPISEAKIIYGVEFRANEIQTILDGKFLTNQSTVGKIATLALISIALALIIMHLGTLLSTIIAIAAIVGYYLIAHLFFKTGLILNMVYPFMAIILTFLASWIYKYTIADKKKREMKSAFGHYVSKKLVEEISKNPDLVKLGGEKRQVSVFFSDIQDSTKISEQIDTAMWVAQMNEYFTMMENVIKQVGGTIDKYEGDAIMGFFNAPIPQENHQLLAHLCALEMKKALKILHKKWEPEGKPLLEFRIGINTGEAIVGNFGSKDRFDYTVMGDTVNTASRLESSANKTYGTRIAVAGLAGTSAGEATPGKIIMREIDTVFLPGKSEPVQIFELVCTTTEATEETRNLVETYAAGLSSYRKKDFTTAISHFEKLPQDPPAQVLLERCGKLGRGEQVTGLDENMVFRIFNK
ncbi:MAG: CHASE2 domain-containing protein [Nitrospirota bacterium]